MKTHKIQIPYSKCEGTSFPWWFIIAPHNHVRFASKNDFVHAIAGCIIGPFFSRESAESARNARIYEYGGDSRVYCHSGYYSPDYRNIVEVYND